MQPSTMGKPRTACRRDCERAVVGAGASTPFHTSRRPPSWAPFL